MSNQEPGEESLFKVIGNIIIVNLMETVAEGQVLAEKTGLKIGNLHSCLSTVFGGPYQIYSKCMSSDDYYRNQPLVPINECRRLASEVLELAHQSGTSLKAYEQAAKHMGMVQRRAKACRGFWRHFGHLWGSATRERPDVRDLRRLVKCLPATAELLYPVQGWAFPNSAPVVL